MTGQIVHTRADVIRSIIWYQPNSGKSEPLLSGTENQLMLLAYLGGRICKFIVFVKRNSGLCELWRQ